MTSTPGPWEYRDSKIVAVNVKPDWADIDEDYADERVTVVDLRGAMGGEDTAADARLMAEAPAMKDALRVAQERFEYAGDTDHPAYWDICAILARIEMETV